MHEQFHEQTGLALALLDGRRKLPRADVLDALRRRVVGQDEALEAVTDVVSLAKARLNAPDRPLGTLLFMGPTGVGKTECAKALAAFLFGRDEHIVRLDMNEFGSPAAASRLVGTFLEPEGLLTAPVRRQPFCVVLLDEIEKAHPDVFDMLLQVMGEGRLTDAVGRTTDFGGAIVIMTSNLGTREVAQRIGFGGGEEERQRAFMDAAEAFFRPEFVNRIDRMVPFRQLGRDEIRSIAERLLEEVVGREGLVRRRCALNVDPRALDLVVDRGYQPQLGARALKRMLERQLVQPVSARLSTLKPGLPVLVDVHGAREGIVVRVSELTEVEPVGRETLQAAPEEVLGRLDGALTRVEDEIRGERPRGKIGTESLTPPQRRYLEMSAVIARLRIQTEEALDSYGGDDGEAAPDALSAHWIRRPQRLGSRAWLVNSDAHVSLLLESGAASDLHSWLRALHVNGVRVGGSRFDDGLAWLRDRTALLVAVYSARSRHRRGVLFLRGPGRAAAPYVRRLGELYRRAFAVGPFGAGERTDDGAPAADGDSGLLSGCFHDDASGTAHAARDPMAFLVVEGAFAGPLVSYETGTHLMVDRQGSLVPIQVGTLPAGGSNDGGSGPPALSVHEALQSWDQALQARQEGQPGAGGRVEHAPVPPLRPCFDDARRAWLERVDRGEAALEDDPFPLGPVVRVYDERSATVDLRTRTSVARWPEAGDLWTFLGSSLPLGDETD